MTKKHKKELLQQLELCRKNMVILGNSLMFDFPDKAIEALGAAKVLETWIDGIEIVHAEYE